MNQWRMILQWSDMNLNGDCHRFENLSVVDPVHIAIVSDTGLGARAAMLHQAVFANIAMLTNAHSRANANCGGPRLLGCLGRREPTCRSILVVVCSTNRVSNQVEQLMNDWLQNGPTNRIVLPILPGNADVSTVLPGALSRIVVLRDTNGIAFTVPSILLAAGVGSDQFRLFISYRRVDSEKLADQLYDRFSREGFDVFLDRFRGKPGIAFPSQLTEALIDKGLVLAIESPDVWKSHWTIAEVNFAILFRLGLLSIKIPGGTSFSVIQSSDRFDVPSGDWNGLSNPNELSSSCLDQFVQFVRSRYAAQLLRRRVYVESLLCNALASQSLRSQREVNGIHSISHAGGYSIELSTRPPKLENMHRVSDANTSPSQSAVVVGPKGFLDPHARSHLDWLLNKINVASFEEVEMTLLARQISGGNQLP